jgi:hypothetical protein
MAAAIIGQYIVMAAIPIFIDTVIGVVKNETQTTIGKGSIFTFASIIPQLGLTKNTQQMDINLKIILAMTISELKKMIGGEKVPEWADIVSTMKQNVLFEKCENSSRYGIRTYSRDSFDFCKFDGSPNANTIKDIKSWFMSVLDDVDPDLKKLTGVLKDETFESLASIVASTGASVNSISTFIRRSDYEEYTFADIGLVRYPSYENPKAKIFRIKLICWRDCKRVLSFESNKNGITVEIDSQEYIPREEVVSYMRDHVLSEKDVVELCEKVDGILLKI